MKCLQLKCGYAAVLVMIERSAVVVLFGLLTTPPQEGRVFSPCEIVRQAADLDGTVISTRAEIIAGPHDDYLAVEGCTKTGAVDFVLLDLTTHSRKLHKLIHMLSSKHKGKPFPTASITGIISFSREPKYGTIAANVRIEVLSASDIRE